MLRGLIQVSEIKIEREMAVNMPIDWRVIVEPQKSQKETKDWNVRGLQKGTKMCCLENA